MTRFAGQMTGNDPSRAPYRAGRYAFDGPKNNKEMVNGIVANFSDVIPFPDAAVPTPNAGKSPNQTLYIGQQDGQARASLPSDIGHGNTVGAAAFTESYLKGVDK